MNLISIFLCSFFFFFVSKHDFIRLFKVCIVLLKSKLTLIKTFFSHKNVYFQHRFPFAATPFCANILLIIRHNLASGYNNDL